MDKISINKIVSKIFEIVVLVSLQMIQSVFVILFYLRLVQNNVLGCFLSIFFIILLLFIGRKFILKYNANTQAT